MTTRTTRTYAGRAVKDSTVRTGLKVGEHVAAVRFDAWGPQPVTVRAYSGGGRAGAPYIAVAIGTCVTYVYDQGAVDSHVNAWHDAERVNRSVRLAEFVPASATRRHTGQDLNVLTHVSAEQHHSVTSSTGPDGRPTITVTVGAVTVDLHTTTALLAYSTAWRKAASVTGLLEDAREQR